MFTDLVYETHCVSDHNSPIGRFGRVQRMPGGLLLRTDGGVDLTLPIEEPDDQIVDDWQNGHLEINTPKGRFILNRLDREAAAELSPFCPGAPIEFDTDAAAQAYYKQALGPI